MESHRTIALVALILVVVGQVAVAASAAPPSALSVAAGAFPATIVPPTVDTVQVESSGEVAFTGSAEPGAKVEILEGASVLGDAVADAGGRFTLAPTKPLLPGEHVLALRATAVDGSFQLLPDARWTVSVPQRVAALPTVPVTPPPVSSPASPVATPPAAPTVTFGIEKEAPGAAQRPATAPVAVSRVGGPRTVTVQPGDSLWTIAQATLGDGDAWEDIYQANRSRIRNPRWLYPGQVLVIPTTRR